MKTYTEHLVFVAHEMTPNITPVLDRRMKAKKVWIAHTLNMLENAQRLESIYKNHHLNVSFISLSNAFDAQSLISELYDAIRARNIDTDSLAINISCGTKITAVAAVKAFENTQAGIYYLLPNDDLDWVQPSAQPVINVEDNIKLDEFLSAHGIDCIHVEKLTPAQAEFKENVVRDILEVIIENNALDDYQQFSKNLYHPRPNQILSITKDQPKMLRFLQRIEQHGYIRLVARPSFFKVKNRLDVSQKRFFHGGWLEYLAYRNVKALKQSIPQIQDVALSLRSENGKTRDEVDVIFLCNNQLFIIECKTGGSSNNNLHIQRLDSLKKRLGGVLSHAMYLTNNDIHPDGGDAHKASTLGVAYLGRPHLKDLQSHIRDWILSKL